MSRLFTLEQAHRALPAVKDALREAVASKAAMEQAEAKLREINHKVMISGGMMVDREQVGGFRAQRERSVEKLQEAMQTFEEIGCEVKDLDIGLLDFPTWYRGEIVYLCWRLGEDRIEFWHGDEGFRGRKPIDAEFLANHRGEQAS